METKDLQGKLVGVLGYGVEGRAVTSYLLKHGIKPVLFDNKPWAEWPEDEQKKIKSLGINFIFGPDCLKELKGFDVAFRSPGIPFLHPDLQARIKDQGSRMTLTSQTKWFFEHCPAKIIGVTGTKGKGTTSTLLYQMIRESEDQRISNTQDQKIRASAYLTGNIGEVQPLDFLDELKPDDAVVYELSSFQLQDLDRSPLVAVVLMTTQEHLDHHTSIDEYHDAKANIARHQKQNDICIYNQDYSASVKIGNQSAGIKYAVSRFQPVSSGCSVQNGKIVAHLQNGDYEFDTKYLQLRGQHNLENICAATCAALSLKVHPEDVQKSINHFKGLRHRLEFVGVYSGVNFYNDSFSTTPETAIAAMAAFTEPEIIILGGSSKHSDFTELGKAVAAATNLKSVILIGEEAARIKDAVLAAGGFHGKFLEGAKSMGEIFMQIKSIAVQGDVVVLSPACASFGMFKNYKDRGNQFTACAKHFSL